VIDYRLLLILFFGIRIVLRPNRLLPNRPAAEPVLHPYLLLVSLWTSVGWAFKLLSVSDGLPVSIESVLEGVNRSGVDDMLRNTVHPLTDKSFSWGRDGICWRIARYCVHKDHVSYLRDGRTDVRWCSSFLSKLCSTRWDHLVASSPPMLLALLNVIFAHRRVSWSWYKFSRSPLDAFQTLYILLDSGGMETMTG